MRALIYTGPETIEFTEAPPPPLAMGESLINVAAVGICDADMNAYLGRDAQRPAPLILGQEASGVVANGPDSGRKVVINPLVSCGKCRDCLDARPNLCRSREIISIPPRQGAFAEQVSVPTRNLLDVPDGLDLTRAVLADPLATAWHAVVLGHKHTHRPLVESRALVFGSGAVGLGVALTLRAFGCQEVTIAETNPLRRKTASDAGFTQVVDPSIEGELPESYANIVIDAVGSQSTRNSAIFSATPGGVIVHIGLADGADGLDARTLTLQEISLVGATAYTPGDFRAALEAMARGTLGPLDWFEARDLSDGPGAFADLAAGRAEAAKIILQPGAADG